MEGNSSRGGASTKTAKGREPSQSVAEKRGRIQARLKYAQGLAVIQPKALGRGARVKSSRYGYNQRKNQGNN